MVELIILLVFILVIYGWIDEFILTASRCLAARLVLKRPRNPAAHAHALLGRRYRYPMRMFRSPENGFLGSTPSSAHDAR